MGVSKVVYGGRTLVDITGITVTPETLLKGATAVNSAGEIIEGDAKASVTNLFFETKSETLSLGALTFEG